MLDTSANESLGGANGGENKPDGPLSHNAGMRRVASCPDHKALETMPDPVTEVCDVEVRCALLLGTIKII